MHLTNKEILDKLLSYSEDLKHHYNLYQLLLFHFQIFQTVFKTFLKDKEKIVNALQLPYSNAKLEATNWKQLIISLNSSNAMLLVFETLKTSKKGFSSLSTSKKKGRISSFLDLAFLQPTTVDKEPFYITLST